MKQVVVAGILAMSLLLVAVGTSAQENDAWIPGIASFVIPGLGQVLNDQLNRGIIHFGVDVAIWALGFYGATFLPPLVYATPALHLGWAIYSGFDAYKVAKAQGFTIGFVENGVGFSYSF
jgi:hypothetical protein